MINPIFTATVFIAGVIFFCAFYVIGYSARWVFFGQPENKESFIDAFLPCLLSLSIVAVFGCLALSREFTSLMVLEVIVQSMGLAFGIRDANNKMIGD